MSDDSDDSSIEEAARPVARRRGGRRPNAGEEEAFVQKLRRTLQLKPSREFPALPVLYGLPQKEVGLAASTETSNVRSVWPWYDHFCTQVLEQEETFVDPEGKAQTELFGLSLYRTQDFSQPLLANSLVYDKDHVRKFFRWMADLPVPRNLLAKCKTFFNAHLRPEYYNRLLAAGHPYPTLGSAALGNEGFTAQILSAAAGQQLDRAREEFLDIHTNVEKPITLEENHRMLRQVFEPIPNGQVAKLDAVFRIVYAASYTAQKANIRRGEEHYKQWYNHRFLRLNPCLGTGQGPFVHHNKSDRSKHNTQGRCELFAVLPHRDPILDSTAWSGLLLLYRLIVMKEPFPDFQDHEKLWYYAAYPSVTPQNPHAEAEYVKKHGGVSGQYYRISSEQYRKSWTSFYRDNKITTGHITKQWRHQSYHDGDDRGCDQPAIQKMAGWKHNQHGDKETKAEREHYATNVPLRGTVTFAGGDPQHPEYFHLPRYVTVFDALLSLFEPVATLVSRQKEVATLYGSYSTKAALDKDRVTTAHEVAQNVLEELRNCLRFLASRPVDPKTFLVKKGERCFFDEYRHCSTFKPLFDHPAFLHPLWTDLQNRVRAAEDADFDSVFVIPARPRNDMERFYNQCRTMIGHLGQHMQQELQHTRDAVREYSLNAIAQPPIVSPNSTPPSSVGRVVPVIETTPLVPDAVPRKKRKHVSHEAVRRAELPARGDADVPRPLLANKDRLFNSAREYWRMWKDEFEPLELKFGVAWRNDLPYAVEKDGKRSVRRPNTKATWWNERHFIWDCIAHYIDPLGMSESDAIAKAERLFERCRRSNGKRGKIRDVHKVFSKEASRLNIRQVGRPKGSRLDAFERAFAEQEQDVYEAPEPPVPRQPFQPEAARQQFVQAATRGWEQQQLLDPTNPSGLSTNYNATNAHHQRIYREWQERARNFGAQQARLDAERFDPADLVNRGRRVHLPPIGNFETRLPEGAATPPERRARYGEYRPDYRGTRWTANDSNSVEVLATMRDLWDHNNLDFNNSDGDGLEFISDTEPEAATTERGTVGEAVTTERTVEESVQMFAI